MPKSVTVQAETQVVVNGQINMEVTKALAKFDKKIREIEAQRELYRHAILEAMEANGITKFENPYVRITYVEATTKTTLDSKKLKAEKPEIYEQYSKTSDVKAYVKIDTFGL